MPRPSARPSGFLPRGPTGPPALRSGAALGRSIPRSTDLHQGRGSLCLRYVLSMLELSRAKRHVTFLERIVAHQELVIARLEALGDADGAAQARGLMSSFNFSLELARDQVERLQSK